MASEYFWGNKPSDHAPIIGGKQFLYDGAFFAKSKAEKSAEDIRVDILQEYRRSLLRTDLEASEKLLAMSTLCSEQGTGNKFG